MAYDACMVRACVSEVRKEAQGGKIEKVLMPTNDEVVFIIRSRSGVKKLLLNAGCNNPRFSFTEETKENPMVPPMLCMLLRKHLVGAKLTNVYQEEFERVVTMELETRDEMGFSSIRYFIAELMGRYANLIFTDGNKKIISALRVSDFSEKNPRAILPGLTYELPPKQDKCNPLKWNPQENPLDKDTWNILSDHWLLQHFQGISSSVAKQISWEVFGSDSIELRGISKEQETKLLQVFKRICNEEFSPCMVSYQGKAIEYACIPLTYYIGDFQIQSFDTVQGVLDEFYGKRDREQYLKSKASDLLKLLSNLTSRLQKKISLQSKELLDAEKCEEYKVMGDAITSSIYLVKQGMESVTLPDYNDALEDGTFPMVKVTLDKRLSPAANAQSYYKKYAKCKNAKVRIQEQIEIANEEIVYLESVTDALHRTFSLTEIEEIREELISEGYIRKSAKGYKPNKKATPKITSYHTTNGYLVMCGKNNLQNDYLTHKLASKNDYWFHIKGAPGSHVVLFTEGKEPDVIDFTEAAEIAAFNSSKGDSNSRVEVDYTFVKNLKKPPSAKPGYVIYHTNWSCVVEPKDGKK